jgi:hypothetical protein
MIFKDILIGENFFDPNSGEYFIKVTDNSGKFISGGDYFEGEVVEFDNSDFVSRPWPESGY